MPYTLAEVAAAMGTRAEGDTDVVVAGLAEPRLARADELALATSPRYEAQLAEGNARVALLSGGTDWRALGLAGAVFTQRAHHSMAGLTALYDPRWRAMAPGIHPTSYVDPDATIGPDCSIGPFCVIGAGATIGAGLQMASHSSIGDGVQIGSHATLREGVRILSGVTIGDRFVAQPNAVIGGDGFSFATARPSKAETMLDTSAHDTQEPAQPWNRVHSLGGVIIGDDVEIGAVSCVDAGTLRATRIGNGTKIDNLVQVSHNVIIGEHCLMCGSSGAAGSTVIGNGVIVAGAAKIADNLHVGDAAVIAAAAVALANVPAGRIVMGYPAQPMDKFKDFYKAQLRLPRIAREVRDLKKRVSPSGEKP